jgi:hypothetical protein
MGIKRFLVAGGMASLVLMGVLLIVDTEGFAQQIRGKIGNCTKSPDQCQSAALNTAQNCTKSPDQCQTAAQNTGQDGVSYVKGKIPMDDQQPPDSGTTPGGDGGTTPGGDGGTTPGGDGGAGMEMAMGGGGADGASSDGVVADGTSEGGGAMVMLTNLPETGGLPVVLLLTSALLLGSGLLMVAIVRSVRS